MTKEEYNEALKQLAVQYEHDKKVLAKKFALLNNTVKEGDIVTDHIGKLLVKKIQVYLAREEPQCVYSGIELTKDGEPKKKQDKDRLVYQSNLI